MKRTKSAMVLMVLGALLMAMHPAPAQAGENPVGFFVRAIPPQNQVDGSVSYFSLETLPGQRQTLEVAVVNLNDEAIRVRVEVNTAYTNQNGVIEYGATDEKNLAMTADLAEWISVESPELTVPANGEATARFTLQMPEEPFEGELLGGITFVRADSLEEDGRAEQGGIWIRNIFQYCVAIHLTQGGKAAEAAFEIDGARMERVAGFPALVLNIRNPRPLLAGRVELSVRVYPQGGAEAALSFDEQISIAPYTAFSFNRMIDGAALPAGIYRVEAELRYQGQAWQYELPLAVE